MAFMFDDRGLQGRKREIMMGGGSDTGQPLLDDGVHLNL